MKFPLRVRNTTRPPDVPGAHMELECADGYRLAGPAHFTCSDMWEPHGPSWNPPFWPDCMPELVRFDCELRLEPGVVASAPGLRVGETASFKCLQPNYFLTRESRHHFNRF